MYVSGRGPHRQKLETSKKQHEAALLAMDALVWIVCIAGKELKPGYRCQDSVWFTIYPYDGKLI